MDEHDEQLTTNEILLKIVNMLDNIVFAIDALTEAVKNEEGLDSDKYTFEWTADEDEDEDDWSVDDDDLPEMGDTTEDWT